MSGKGAIGEAFKVALSMALMYWLALWQNWEMPGNGGLAIALVSMGSAGASFNKGVLRILGTTIGLVVAFVALAFFGQSPMGFLIFGFLYVVFVGYMMQSSSASYAWFVGGFLPFSVWSSSYMNGDMGTAVFHYGSFRYLETTSGILIYTVVSILIWPKRAGSGLRPQGKAVWSGIREWFGESRKAIGGESDEVVMSGLGSKVAGAMKMLGGSLEASYADSSGIRKDKELWETMRVNLRGMTDVLELWHESVRDCDSVDLHKVLTGLDPALDVVDQRLERLVGLWSEDGESDDRDESLLSLTGLDWAEGARSGCSAGEVASVTNFLLQWKLVDRLSVESLRSARIIAGLESKPDVQPERLAADRSLKVWWDPQRVLTALFPATCFVVGYIFWLLVDPPSGPSIPSTVVALSLNSVLKPVNTKAMLVVLLLGLWICVAPVYMWVMPSLDNGTELLVMIFTYTFVFSWLGGKNPVLKLIPLLLMTSVTNISNDQTYSFMALVGGAQMFLYCLTVIAVVDMLWSSNQPQHAVIGGLRRYFNGCSSVMEGFSSKRGDRLRKRHFDSAMVGVPEQIQAAAMKLDPKIFPGFGAKQIKPLVEGMQAITLRLQALELAQRQTMADEERGMLGSAGEEIGVLIRDEFRSLGRLEGGPSVLGEEGKITAIAAELESRVEAAGDRLPAAYHAMIGSARGLLRAIDQTRRAMSGLDCHVLERARF